VNAYIDALDRARGVFDLAETIGFNFTILDIGGGFPGVDDIFLEFEQIGRSISKKLDDIFPNITIIAQPGRFIASACCTLVTKVISIRDETLSGETSVDFSYYINESAYGTFNNIFYDPAATIIPNVVQDHPGYPYHRCNIFGPTQDGMDIILSNYLFPKLSIDEWIYWNNMGAYTMGSSSVINGYAQPVVHYIWRLYN